VNQRSTIAASAAIDVEAHIQRFDTVDADVSNRVSRATAGQQLLRPLVSAAPAEAMKKEHQQPLPLRATGRTWVLSVAQRRFNWLLRKHPKMDRQKLQTWAFGKACNGGYSNGACK
jgi:hypothetical protein